MVTNRPPKPYARPTRMSCHNQTSPRSALGPLPRREVMRMAVPAARTVGTASATVRVATEVPSLAMTTPISSDTPRNTASTTTYAPTPQRWVRVDSGGAPESCGVEVWDPAARASEGWGSEVWGTDVWGTDVWGSEVWG